MKLMPTNYEVQLLKESEVCRRAKAAVNRAQSRRFANVRRNKFAKRLDCGAFSAAFHFDFSKFSSSAKPAGEPIS